jgi:hypothetical protein
MFRNEFQYCNALNAVLPEVLIQWMVPCADVGVGIVKERSAVSIHVSLKKVFIENSR